MLLGPEPRASGLSRQYSATKLRHPLATTPLSLPGWLSYLCTPIALYRGGVDMPAEPLSTSL